MAVARIALRALTLLAPATPSLAEEPPEPLRFTVRPSRPEDTETLDEKLARRERSFRFICIGCMREQGPAGGGAPFEPVRTLGAPGLSEALQQPSVEPGPPFEPEQP